MATAKDNLPLPSPSYGQKNGLLRIGQDVHAHLRENNVPTFAASMTRPTILCTGKIREDASCSASSATRLTSMPSRNDLCRVLGSVMALVGLATSLGGTPPGASRRKTCKLLRRPPQRSHNPDGPRGASDRSKRLSRTHFSSPSPWIILGGMRDKPSSKSPSPRYISTRPRRRTV